MLAAPEDRLTFLHSAAHDLENGQNPVSWRLARVADWLTALPRWDAKAEDLIRRTEELIALGFRNFDAFHIACAELGGAEAFVTADDRLLGLGERHAALLGVRVLDVVTLAREVFS